LIGIIVGLQAEAAVARRLGWPVEIGGGGFAGALDAAKRLLARGATSFVSFGLAGGLRPGLSAGTVITPAWIVDHEGRRHPTNVELASQFGRVSGTLLAGRRVVGTAQGKAEAWRTTQADAIDVETAAVLDVAAGRPIAAFRAICDPAEHSLPAGALSALTAHGRIGVSGLVWSVACRPGQIGSLLALGREAAAARNALRHRVQVVGPLTDIP